MGDVGIRGCKLRLSDSPPPLASGDAATAADQGTPNGQLGNGALFTPAVMPPKLNNGTNITNVSTLPYVAVYTRDLAFYLVYSRKFWDE